MSQQGVKVTIRGLNRNYGTTQVLKNINLDVLSGETFVIMGPSGSGKSVLLRHIIGLEAPDSGEILIDGESIANSATRDRCRMAMVFQSGALLNSLTVEQNVGLYLEEHHMGTAKEIKRIVAEKLDLVGLNGQQEKLPVELSGGMRKRAAIARALVADPQLILYDEPTSELDPIMAATVVREIQNLKNRVRCTSIVVSHDRDLALSIGDRVAIIKDGEILDSGTPAEIKNSSHPDVRKFLTVDYSMNNERLAL